MLLTCIQAGAATYDWAGTSATNGFYYWDVAANWRVGLSVPSTGPGAADIVRIGIAYTFTGQPTVRTNSSCASVTFGSMNGAIDNNLAVNAGNLLTVTGDIIQNHGTTLITSGTNYRTVISGGGSINVQNVYVGLASQTPSALLSGYLVTFFSSQINSFTINGSVYLNSVTNGAAGYNYPRFQIDNNTVYLYGQIYPQNIGTYTGTLPANDPYRSRFNVGDPSLTSTSTNACTLYLYNAQAILPNRPSKAAIDFQGTSGTNTVVYAGTTGTQTVYTAGTDFGSVPYNYGIIRFEGAALKQFAGGSATIGSDWTSAGGKVDAITNLTAVNFAGIAQTLTDNGSDAGNGVVFKSVSFTNSGTKTLQTGRFSVSADGLLSMSTNSSTQLAAGGNLYLLSGAAGSASVGVMPANCSITGNVNVQRYIAGGSTKSGNTYIARGYRLLSNAVYGTVSNGIANINMNYLVSSGMLVSGPGGTANGFAWPNNNPTLYLFRENVANNNVTFTSGKNKGVTKILANGNVNTSDGGTTETTVPVGNGYLVYYVGNTTNPSTKAVVSPTSPPENMVLTSTGTLNQNTIPVNLWYTPVAAAAPTAGKLSYNSAIGVANAGLNMLGNPYACTIDLNAVFSGNRGNITTSVYQLDNVSPGQSYITYSSTGSSSPRASRYVVSGQGFIVRATGANKSMQFTESMKAAQTNPSVILMGLPKQQADGPAGFYVKLEQDSIISSYCGIYFNPAWADSFSEEDATDLNSTSSNVNLSSYTTDGLRASVNKLGDYTEGKKIKLYINASLSGPYQLKLEDIRNIDTLYNIWLRDKLVKDSLDIRRYGSYRFRVNKSDTASFGANRFELVIRQRPVAPYQLVNFKAEKVAGGISVTWKTYNEGTYTGFTLQKQDSIREFQPLMMLQSNSSGSYSYVDKNPSAGINTYRLAQNDINYQISYSGLAVVNNTVTGAQQNISVYPNPAVQRITLTLKNTGDTGSTASIYNTAGQLMIRGTVNNTVATYDVSGFKTGTYLLRLIKPDGALAGQTIFIKN